ncbi:hypothetical protein EAT49_18910 [Histidinibacterium lentulum]|uniref:Uncharacterized protein n=1 Tax=Histidinibacterium lentulum TaxID=2480588 RepID=A0A3N2QM84_9RHOB|nr:hypothetical protein EAT49_18910 [Histidinibacterium lentulum]
MGDLFRVHFECKDCGGTVLTVDDHHTDASIVRCRTCGVSQGTFGDLKSNAIRKALESLLPKLAQSLKK